MGLPAPAPDSSDSEASAPGSTPRGPAGRREHALLALVELNRTLGRSQDVYGTSELLLLNLLGQVGTARGALCLGPGEDDGRPVVVRSHGIERSMVRALAAACWFAKSELWSNDSAPLIAASVTRGIGSSIPSLAKLADVAVIAPIVAERELLGLVTLGSRLGGRPYDPVDLQVVEASLAIAAVALRSTLLHIRVLEANRRLRVANQELRELDRLKSEFLSNVNHELRTPLTIVMGSLACLKEPGIVGEPASKLVDMGHEAAHRLMGQLERLLTFSVVARDDVALRPIDADLSIFLTEYHAARQPGIGAGLRELHWTADGRAHRAEFDPQRLREVLDELVDNAVKFTRSGTNIWLKLDDHVEDGRTWQRIDVEDDGPGIPAERVPLLFESFVQGDGSTTREVGGLGLGLAAARRLVLAMGGRLTASQGSARGARFSILLPAL